MNIFEITIQQGKDGSWPVETKLTRSYDLLPIHHKGELKLSKQDINQLTSLKIQRQKYGQFLGRVLFQDEISEAYLQALDSSWDGMRVLLTVEDKELETLYWHWLCAPREWNSISLNQRCCFSISLKSSTERVFPPINQQNLKALILAASPQDLENYSLASFDVQETVKSLKTALGQIPTDVLAVDGGLGMPTLDELCDRLTQTSYSLLHIVGHGQVNKQGETILYWATKENLVEPVTGSNLIQRLQNIQNLPHFIFLSACETAKSEAGMALGGLAQRIVRELGIPAVLAMTENVTIKTAALLSEAFYPKLQLHGEVDRALVEATSSLSRHDILVPALFSRLGHKPLFSKSRETLTLKNIVGCSLAVTLLCILVRVLGILEPFELWAFDQLIQFRPSSEPDDRILVVEVTPDERDEWDKVETPYRASLPDEVILKLLKKLDQYNPKVIGLDIYRPFKATQDELAKRLRNDSRLFAVCKVPAENGDKQAPPPEVSEERLGFTDFIQDTDGVLRRYLFKINFKPTLYEKKKLRIKENERLCETNNAISFQLALHYLGEKAQLTEKEFYKIRDVVFKPLNPYAGGYQGSFDAYGHQVLLDYRNFRGSLGKSPKNVAERVTLNQVIQDHVATEDIQRYQNRIILIGIVTRGEEDYWSTPLGIPEVPGVFIQAQMISQILRAVEDGEPLLWYWSLGVEILWIWGWATVGGIIVLCNFRPKYILVMGMTGIIILVCICIFIFSMFNGWLPLIPPVIVLTLTGLTTFVQKNRTRESNNLLVKQKQ